MDSRPAPLPTFDDEAVLSRDRGRLLRLLAAARQAPSDGGKRAAYESALAVSRAARDQRDAAAPVPTFDDGLPVAREADTLIELIRRHPVVVVAGETGSGKTTQLPKLCLAAGRGRAGLIGCTQPRRIAARAVARRVAEELQVSMGGAVGYQVRFTDNVGDGTYIKFMTDGILLAEIQSDRWLSKYDTIIVDEAHERSLNIDFLLGYLKNLVAKRPDLKLVITSATIDTSRFAKHFGDAPVVSVEGRSFPVEVRYRPGDAESDEDVPAGKGRRRDEERGQVHFSGGASGIARTRPRKSEPDPVPRDRPLAEAIVAAADEITREDPQGDVLVFLPGEREIRDAHAALNRRKYRSTEVIPLYARLSVRDQDKVFNPGPGRRIVLATNVAETSLTVPRIRYVIDPGLARVKRYSPRGKLDRLHIEPISQASADQRKGRCGRIAAGICYRLYAEDDFNTRPRYTDPEILRASLAGVILRMLTLGLGRVEDFPFIDPPDPRAIADGWQTLAELGAVDAERHLTPTGREMSRLPVDPKLARMLVAARVHGCLAELVVISSFLGIQDPRERPADAREKADNAHAQFGDPDSEFVGILKLWEAYRAAHEDLTQSKLRDWCEKRFLGFLRMREWRELHRQLLLACEEMGWDPAARAAPEPGSKAAVAFNASLHKALIAGLPSQIGHRSEKGLYDAPRQRKFQLFPGSALAKPPAKGTAAGASPAWLLVATLLDTQKVWGLTAAKIEPDWVIAELPHLLARKHFDPHWSRAQGRVVGSEQISLFGLVLAPKKPVHYGGLYPAEAREIFVRQGLVPGEADTRAPFLKRNLATLEKAREEEAKLRRAGLVADEDWQARWYLDRLPPEVNSIAGLDSWAGKLTPEQKKSLEWSLADLLPGEGSEAERFPKFFPLGDTRLALHYRFEPGHSEDGVTLDVPLHLLKALDPIRLGWLVPGLVEEKATALIRGLPKAQRRNYVPAPDFARAFAEAFPRPEADSLPGTLARFLGKATGVPLSALDFDESALEPHLRMNLRLAEREGRVLAQSRDLDALRARFGEQAERAFADRAGERLARAGLREFPDEAIPAQVPGGAGVPAYPALVDGGESVSLSVFADPVEAAREHGRGVRRLAEFALADKLRQARKQLPVSPKLALLYAAIEGFVQAGAGAPAHEHLRTDLAQAALNAVLADDLGGVRDAAAFRAVVERAGRQLFAEAMSRLQLAEAILGAVAEIKPRLESPLLGWAKGNLDDLKAQLAGLVPPGFLRVTPAASLAEYPRYLKALSLRAERALRDPVRDQGRMLELKPFSDALDVARRSGRFARPEWQQFRWDLEELRVSLFAQELGTRRQVSAKRLARQLEALT
ncbi:ATP-dependent RNA helicase HrpA [Arenimonas terrae]|uniref:ATP-dependent RNA helicase HrpA n=1 Tax=Arenimonas terrae TaxID=2546226 RepID=A0A5C4RVU9_9GAMM|nr:ATP-dependent RNA helicase HrpA [Arenimonas terrae]TNJ35423.1 ATP-dependent RNA helicase HrpA [Arenimonas terrae]